MPVIIPPEDARRGIPLHTFTPELDKDYGRPINCIYVGTTGDLAIENIEGDKIIFKSVPAGKDIVGFFTKIFSSGTTATDLVAQRIQ